MVVDIDVSFPQCYLSLLLEVDGVRNGQEMFLWQFETTLIGIEIITRLEYALRQGR
jgi:hypothetical protein